jgi:glycosyltransferase involved in cell wall biosynthesis
MSTTRRDVVFTNIGGKTMKVLFQIRPGYRDGPSGDSIQMFMTKIHLERLGVEVDISSRPDIHLSEFDLIHIFNCTRVPEAYAFYKNAIHQKKKIVLSPIFIDMREYYRGRPDRLAAWRAENILRREMFQGSHMLLPNSKKEWEWIKEILMVNTMAKVIYHGVNPVFFEADKSWFIDKFKQQDYILCVGRLSPIKNQLSLIRAVKDLDVPVVLIGPVNNREYAEKCAEQADGLVKYIPALNQNELASAYCAARVHVQPSWFETVGLTSLEAGASGTPVVITDRGAAREYFNDLAYYVDPGNPDSIRTGILSAIEQTTSTTRSSSKLKSYIREHLTWEKAAWLTLEAYKQVLKGGCQSKKQEQVTTPFFYSQSYPLPRIKGMPV